MGLGQSGQVTLMEDPEEQAIVAEAEHLKRLAARWSVEVPEDWYVASDDDGALFIVNHLNAQTGKALTPAQANELIALAQVN